MELSRSQQKVSTRPPVERELETRKAFGAFVIFLFSMSVPYFVMINVRYIMVAGFVPSTVDQTTGVIETVLMVLSGLTALAASRALKGNNAKLYRTNGILTMILGGLATLMLIWEWWFHPFDPMSHYGETFLTTIGLCVFMHLVGLGVLMAANMRMKRVGITEANALGYRLNNVFWMFIVVTWVAMWLQLYFI